MLENIALTLESWGVSKALDQLEYLLDLPTMAFAIWETLYAPLLATIFAYVIGLPLGILLVIGEEGGIKPLPKSLMQAMNTIIKIVLYA